MKRRKSFILNCIGIPALAAPAFCQIVPVPNVCLAPDNGTGTIDWPAQCVYGTALEPVELISTSGERIQMEISIPPMAMTCVPGPSGATYHSGLNPQPVAIPAFVRFVRQSKTSEAGMNLTTVMENDDPAPPGGDRQTIETEILSMSLTGNHPQLGDLDMTAEPGGTGTTTLTRLPSGDFTVASFFDVYCRIEFQGAPGSDFEGVIIDTQEQVLLRQTIQCIDGVCVAPVGQAQVTYTGSELVVSNIGSSGEDGVRFAAGDGIGSSGEDGLSSPAGDGIGSSGQDGLCVAIFDPQPLQLGGKLSVGVYPPPQRGDQSGTPPTLDCTNSGGTVSCVYSSGDLGATQCVVEVWDSGTGQLVGVGVCNDGTVCYSVPDAGFLPELIEASALLDDRGALGVLRRPTMSLTFLGPTAVTIPGQPAPFVGDRVVCAPRDPQVLPNGVSELCIKGNGFGNDPDDLCVAGVAIGRAGGGSYSGVGHAVLTTDGGRLRKISNLGSSGCDGFSVALPDDDEDDQIPYVAELAPLDMLALGGSFYLSAHDASGASLVQCRHSGGGGGAGGSIFIEASSFPVCRVTVLNNGVEVGERNVALGPAGETPVCGVAPDGATGNPLLASCGVRRQTPAPFDFVLKYDRPFRATPAGGSTLVGDELRLHWPDATPQTLASIVSLQLRAADMPSFTVCDETVGTTPPHPVLPPDDFASFDYPGTGARMVHSVPTYLDLGNGEVICIFSSLTNLVEVADLGGRKDYTADLVMTIEGVGGFAYSRVVALPGTFAIQHGQNRFVGQDTQQFSTRVLSFQFAVPPGDPDFDQLRLAGVSGGGGLTSDGEVTITKIPECRFVIDEIQDILSQIDLTGAVGGPFDGVTASGAYHQSWHLDQTVILFGGLANRGTGGAQLATDANDRLVVSNIGSSGCDGVSIDLGDVEGFEVEFDPAQPLQLQPGGSLTFEEFGRVRGASAGGSLGVCTLTNQNDLLYDVVCDFSSVAPSSTTIQVYDGGHLVTGFPVAGAVLNFEAREAGPAGLAPLRSVGKLPGLSAVPCKRVRWRDRISVHVQGQPPAAGDEVRLLAHGVGYESISRFELRASDVVSDILVAEEGVGATFSGRRVAASCGVYTYYWQTGPTRAATFGVLEEGVEIALGNGDWFECHAPPSQLLNGNRQLWPMAVDMRPTGLPWDTASGSLSIEACGTINGQPGTSYGTLTAEWDGNEVRLSGDFSTRGTTEVDLIVLDRNGEEIATARRAAVDIARFGFRQEFGQVQGGLRSISAVPELYEPPFDEVERSYSLRFYDEVTVTIPGQGPVTGSRIDVRLVNPTHDSEDIECLRVTGSGLKPLTVTRFGTGPFGGHGLTTRTVGSAQIEEAQPGSKGPLVISGIGSSGCDGVSIDLGDGDGAWQTIQPLDLATSGGTLRVTQAEVDQAADEIDEVVSLALDHEPFVFYDIILRAGPDSGGGGGDVMVVGTTRDGRHSGDQCVVVVSDGDIRLGALAPQSGLPAGGRVVGCGLLPPAVIPGVGHVGEGIAFEFEEPMVFTPTGGGAPFSCEVIRVVSLDGLPPGEPVSRTLTTQTSGVARVDVTGTELIALGGDSYSSVGQTLFSPVNGAVVVDQLSDSGVSGVRKHPGRTAGTFQTEIVAMDLSGAPISTGGPPPPGGGAWPCALLVSGEGTVDGNPGPLGEMTIPLQSSQAFVEIDANLQPLFAGGPPNGEIKVVVVCRSVACPEETFLVAGTSGVVCRCYGGGAEVVRVGRLDERETVGGVEGPGFFVDLSSQVEFTPPGGAPGTGFIGDRIEVRAQRNTGSWDTEILSMDLRGNTPGGSLTLLPPPPGGLTDFGTFLLTHFTPAEITAMDPMDYATDTDADSLNEIEEFIRGTDPKMPDADDRGPTSSAIVVPGQAGQPGERFVRYSYQLDPDAQGVDIVLEASTDLSQFVDDPSLWRLVGLNSLANGNLEYVWERTTPMRATQKSFHRHKGHVTILK